MHVHNITLRFESLNKKSDAVLNRIVCHVLGQFDSTMANKDYVGNIAEAYELFNVLLRQTASLKSECDLVTYGQILEAVAWEDIKENGGALGYMLPHLSSKLRAIAFVIAFGGSEVYTRERWDV